MKDKECIAHLNEIHFTVILVMLEIFVFSRDIQEFAIPRIVNMLKQIDNVTVEQTLTNIDN